MLIFDEVTAAWRSHHGGIHLQLGVAPDIAVFAKSLSNGFPMAAIIGRGTVMEAAQRTFVSSTYWTEGIGPAAALATLPRLREIDAVGRIHATGERVRAIWREAAVTHHLPIKVGGLPALANFTFELGDDSRAYLTLFTQEMLAAGFLAGSPFYPTCAHTVEDTERYAAAVDRVFAGLRRHPGTRFARPGFARTRGAHRLRPAHLSQNENLSVLGLKAQAPVQYKQGSARDGTARRSRVPRP